MANRIRGISPKIQEAAKQLRKNLTPAESLLWQKLRSKQLDGLKFRCQHPVGSFILDFYCPALKLVIEIDGKSHQNQQEYDQARTDQLSYYGYHVVRFTNEEIFQDVDKVVEKIKIFTAQL
jgi:very-short-patch-repair endonuclease